MRTATLASALAGALLLWGATASADHHEAGGDRKGMDGAMPAVDPPPPAPTDAMELRSPSDAIASIGEASTPRVPETLVAASEGGIDAWRERRGWRYGSDFLFPLSRGLLEQDLHPALRYGALPVVVPVDLASLPLGLLAGLYGD